MKSFDAVFKQFKDNTKPMCELMGCPELVDDFIVDVEINRQSFKSFYEAGQQSKQAEVDELRKEFDDFKLRAHHISVQRLDIEAFYDYEKNRANGLQKRVDVALDHAVNHGGYDDLTHIINILKGENYES